ncbi:MAG TPA: hypothetical protein VIW24_17185 [Aldersonia sp.]
MVDIDSDSRGFRAHPDITSDEAIERIWEEALAEARAESADRWRRTLRGRMLRARKRSG